MKAKDRIKAIEKRIDMLEAMVRQQAAIISRFELIGIPTIAPHPLPPYEINPNFPRITWDWHTESSDWVKL